MSLKKISVAASAVLALTGVMGHGGAQAASFFWAVNQFVEIQELNGDTGAVVQSFPLPFGAGNGASIAVVGNTGYYTLLNDANVYKVDMTTHAALGTAFTVSDSSYMNGITVDSNNHFWFAHGLNSPLQEYDIAGNLLSTHAFPTDAFSYRDGSVVFGNTVIANRGDQAGPYDKYNLPGSNDPLTYIAQPFIDTLASAGQNNGFNGIAFNGVNFYASNEQQHKVYKYDINGNFVSVADLDPSSRYENWTFAAQDITPPVPIPASLPLMGSALAALGLLRRKKRT